ncbi:MAG TPA: ComEC/Rec2 family competence protein [Candidatus Saccharimonadales bacterium]|nr:ComEC/Rec2 family competence protein [Candidatus Saccharimonadales bacterium]
MFGIKRNRSAQITILAAAALAGILAGRAGLAIDGYIVGVSLALVILSVSRRIFGKIYRQARDNRTRGASIFWVLLMTLFMLGIWRGNTTIFAKTALGQHIGQKVTLAGQLADDPARSEKNYTVFTIGNAELEGHKTGQAVRITAPYKELKRGQRVQVSGKLQANLGSVPARMFSPVTVLDTRISPLEKWRQRFFAAVHSVLPEPIAGFGLGLLVGVRALIDKPLQDTLTLVGLSHLVAVSGYNLTIIVRAVNKAIKRVSLFSATAVSLWLIFGFMLVAGFSASIVRAAIVSVLALMAGYYGHRVKPMTLIAIPAAVTALYRPSYLTSDLGWQLSFLAFFGILVLAPLIRDRFKLSQGFASQVILESLCAQLLTFPLIMLIFGQFSIVSPVANAIIVPLVPLAMLLTLVAGVVALLVPAVAGIIALPAAGLIGLMLAVIDWLAHFKFSSTSLSLDPFLTAMTYIWIVVVTAILARRVTLHRQANSPS